MLFAFRCLCGCPYKSEKRNSCTVTCMGWAGFVEALDDKKMVGNPSTLGMRRRRRPHTPDTPPIYSLYYTPLYTPCMPPVYSPYTPCLPPIMP